MAVERGNPTDIKEKLEQSAVTALYVYPIKSCAASALEIAEVVPTGIKHDRELMLTFPNGRFISQRNRGCEKLAVVLPDFVDDNLVKITAPNMPELYVPIVREGEMQKASVHKTTGIQVVDQGQDAQRWFGEYLGFDCQLVAMAKGYSRQVSQRWAPRETDQVGFADGYPFHLLSQESLDDLNNRLPESLPTDRFRPNIVLAGSGIPYGEDKMKKIRIGNVTLDVIKPKIRCLITTIDQERGEKDSEAMRREPLSTLAKYRICQLKTGDKGVVFGQDLIHENSGTISIGGNIQIIELGTPPRFAIKAVEPVDPYI